MKTYQSFVASKWGKGVKLAFELIVLAVCARFLYEIIWLDAPF